MQNIQMIGVHHLDRFRLKGCFLVIGAFGVVTLISYFNELAKAGLLSGNPKFKMMSATDTFKRSIEDVELLGPFHEPREARDKIILQKDGDFHHLDLNLLPIDNEKNVNETGEETEIKIALHLGKNDDYLKGNESDTKIYQFHNTLPNFYLTIGQSLSAVVNLTGNLSGEAKYAVHNFSRTMLREVALYRNRSKVLVYQHDPGGYATRDCFVSLSLQNEWIVAQVPLNSIYRKNWEMMSREQREKYDVLYGSLAFGACESRREKCSNIAMISHPLDRLLQAYWLCNGKQNMTMCHFFHTGNITTIHGFIERHGSALFHKLLYYSRHCRLVGNDEICIHDNNIYFVLSHAEKVEYLTDILNNVEKWFSVVGILEELDTSLAMISRVVGVDLHQCTSSKFKIPHQIFKIFHKFHRFRPLNKYLLANLRIDGMPYFKMREKLLADPMVLNWLFADMEIYVKFVEIFHRQVEVYNNMRRLQSVYYSPFVRIPWINSQGNFSNSSDTIITSGPVAVDDHSHNVSCSVVGNKTECKLIPIKRLKEKSDILSSSYGSDVLHHHNDSNSTFLDRSIEYVKHNNSNRNVTSEFAEIHQETAENEADISTRAQNHTTKLDEIESAESLSMSSQINSKAEKHQEEKVTVTQKYPDFGKSEVTEDYEVTSESVSVDQFKVINVFNGNGKTL